VKVGDLGATTEGLRTIAAIVSAPENIRNLDRIRAANQVQHRAQSLATFRLLFNAILTSR
jgi:hypothetical protein